MTALTAPRNSCTARTRYGDTWRIPMAADAVIFIGGMVCVDADGYAVAAADTVDYKFAGVCIADQQDPTACPNGKYDNDGGEDGDVEVVVRWQGRARYKYASPVLDLALNQNMLCAKVYVQDDQTVSVHQFDSTNDVCCGHVCRLPGTTLAAHPETDLDADEIEIEFSGEPFEYDGSVTTTTTGA